MSPDSHPSHPPEYQQSNPRAVERIDNRARVRHSGGMAKPALGRGLGALLGNSPIAKPPGAAPASTTVPGAEPAKDTRERVQRVPLGRVRPCPFQPRKDFPPETLRELADSIKEQGIVQPLIVRDRGDHLELIAGERRWRAAQLLGLAEVPVILREADDRAVLELALIENLQRENLNAIEEAQGYIKLATKPALGRDASPKRPCLGGNGRFGEAPLPCVRAPHRA